MDILAELTDLKTQHQAATELLESANTEILSAKAAIEAKEWELADKSKAFAEKESAFIEAQEILAAHVANLEAEIGQLKAKEQTAEAKAIEFVASQGINPIKIGQPESGSGMSKAEAIASYNAIQDSIERGQFYAKHKALLIG